MASTKQTIGGVLSGAGSGAAIGTAFLPGVGTAIGAGVGGLAGLVANLIDQGASEEEILAALAEGKPEEISYDMYAPEEFQYETLNEDPALLEAQREYLGKVSQLADTGLSEVDAAALEKATNVASQKAKAGRDAALTQARARGVGGGGMEFVVGEQAAQDSYQDARQAAFDKAAQTAQQRALYQIAYGDALSGQRDQGFRAESTNKGIINDFNKLNTGAKNAASQYNIENAQRGKQVNNENRARYAEGVARVKAGQAAADQDAMNAGIGAVSNAGTSLVGLKKHDELINAIKAGRSSGGSAANLIDGSDELLKKHPWLAGGNF